MSETDYHPHPSNSVRLPRWVATLWRWTLTLLTLAALVIVFLNLDSIAIRARLRPSGSLFSKPIWLFVAVAMLLLLVSAIHELGHLLAGRAARLQFQIFVLGPLRIRRVDGRLHAEFIPNPAIYNGLVASIPLTYEKLGWRMTLFALGGPLASLFLALTALTILAIFQGQFNLHSPLLWLQECAALVAAASFLFFTTTMSPRRYSNGLPTDGNRVLTLLMGGQPAQRWCALVALDSASVQGVRPRQWSEPAIELALSQPDESPDDLTARLLAYQWALDGERFQRARELLQDTLALRLAWTSPLRADLALEAAYFAAAQDDDASGARVWLNKVRRGRRQTPRQSRAAAAVYLSEGEWTQAIENARQGLAALHQPLNAGLALAERDWLQALLAQGEAGATRSRS